MPWNPIRNSDYLNPKEQYNIKCPKYNQDATITVFYRTTQNCKKDIQPTPIKSGMRCNLWDEKGSVCPECPAMLKKTLTIEEKKDGFLY